MARIVRHELVRGYSGAVDRVDQGLVVEFTETYTVQADGVLDNDLPILLDRRTPLPGRPHRTIPGVWAIGVQTETEDNENWTVDVDFSSEADQKKASNPLARPAETSMRGARTRELVRIDGEGNPLRNTAGDPVAPQEVEVSVTEFTVTKNIPPRYPAWLEAFDNTVNAGAIFFAGRTRRKKTLKLGELTISEVQKERDEAGNVHFFRVLEMPLVWKPQGWTRRLINEGFHEVVETTDSQGNTVKKKRRILADDGEPLAEPAFLDRDGKAFRDQNGNLADKAGTLQPGQIVTIEFLPFPTRPFNVLPLQ